ncbi:MAG: ABC transporter ATP-binding protein [Desulfobacteraceae bacterium]|jgi:oligopeptide/dipeptide ABC transporter ATP-binding protein|nr:ABC transporter ATP-binding protein [Desulfobacteraceae bacterium]
MGKKVENLLEIKDLKVCFQTENGLVQALRNVSFEVRQGEVLALVGESGCGKSVTALSVMGLLPQPQGIISGGSIHFQGRDLVRLPRKELRKYTGNEISMIFQEPMTSLNPVYTVGYQICEAIRQHSRINKKAVRDHTIEMLDKVGIAEAGKRFNAYPHQLSGGMRQRVMIAMALSCNPRLLIADEPTTALDVTIQAQILELMIELNQRIGMSMIMITHDLGVVAEIAERVAVMYAGRIVETSQVVPLFTNPSHPYTWGLLGSMPWVDREQERLSPIAGIVPNPFEYPVGCKYSTRCPLVDEKCRQQEPDLIEVEPGHLSACWHLDGLQVLKKTA